MKPEKIHPKTAFVDQAPDYKQKIYLYDFKGQVKGPVFFVKAAPDICGFHVYALKQADFLAVLINFHNCTHWAPCIQNLQP